MGKQPHPVADATTNPSFGGVPDPLALDLSELVGLIASGHPPPWLAGFLKKFVVTLVMNRGVMASAPSRREYRDKLDGVRSATTVLVNALYDVDFELLFVASQLGDAAPRERFRRQLQLVTEQAAVETAALLGPNGKIKAGPGRAFANRTFSSEVECAVLIAESWRHVRGAYPAPRHENAHRAADLLWMAAGELRRQGADNPLGTWRQHFQRAIHDAAPQLLEEFRSDVRRRLRDAAHHHARLTEEISGENGLI